MYPLPQKDGRLSPLGGTIVKKIISLVLALTILVGMLGVSAVAFAEESETPATVTVDQSAVDAFIAADEGSEDERGLSALNTAQTALGKITVPDSLDKTDSDGLFAGMTREFDDNNKLKSNSDKIYVEYFKPDKHPGDFSNANHAAAGDKIDLNEVGTWSFRLIVVRPVEIQDETATTAEGDTTEGEETPAKKYEYKLEKENIVAKSALFDVRTIDVDSPVFSVNSEKLKDLKEKGIVAGTRYSITTTSLFTVTDDGKNSSNSYSYITYNYVIYHNEKGDWVKIYDSAADTKVVEGYSDIVSSSGILASTDDISANATDYKFRIEYSIVDKYNHEGADKDGNKTFVLDLTVSKSTTAEEETQKVDAWKIVLYVIAGLSAVGIVVLLFIKPKQPEGANVINGRVHYGDNDASATDESANSDETTNE